MVDSCVDRLRSGVLSMTARVNRVRTPKVSVGDAVLVDITHSFEILELLDLYGLPVVKCKTPNTFLYFEYKHLNFVGTLVLSNSSAPINLWCVGNVLNPGSSNKKNK